MSASICGKAGEFEDSLERFCCSSGENYGCSLTDSGDGIEKKN